MFPLLWSVGTWAVVLPLLFAAAQPASSSWRQPTISTSRADRISVAQAAIDEATSQIDISTGQFADPGDTYGYAGEFYSQLAEFDLATSQTNYEGTLVQYFAAATAALESQFRAVNFTGIYISDGMNYGRSAAVAYATYKNRVFLEYAQQSWWTAQRYTLTQAQLDAGSIGAKDFDLTSSCDGITMAGGTFHSNQGDDPAILGLSSGMFMVLSALLYESTLEPLYLAAAVQSLNFFRSHLYSTQHLGLETISAQLNDDCAVSSSLNPTNSGLLIEGLAILYSISGNQTLVDMVDDIVTAALSTDAWQGADGIIAAGDVYLPRGLAAAYARNATTSAVRPYIAAYLSVQYNAVTQLARVDDSSNVYGAFSGPPSLVFSLGNQTNAIQALLSVINVDSDDTQTTVVPSGTSPSHATSPPSATSSPSVTSAPNATSASGTSIHTSKPNDSNPTPFAKHAALNAGAIAGGVVGGLAVLATLLGTLFMLRRRRRRNDLKPVPYSVLGSSEPSTPTGGAHGASGATATRALFSFTTPTAPRDGTGPGSPAGAAHAALPPVLAPLRDRKQRPTEQPASPPRVTGAAGVHPSHSITISENTPSASDVAQIPTDELVRVLIRRINVPAENGGVDTPPRYV